MGQCAMIYIKEKGKKPLEVDEWTYDFPNGATKEIYIDCARYYSENYPRGPWPKICNTLMTLMQDPDIEAVWYYSDSQDGSKVPELWINDILRISRFYMLNGNRPWYDDDWETIE